MKVFTALLCAILIAGCSGTHPKGAARYDDFDAVKVEQMVGNHVSQIILSKTVVCLNARRETRRVPALTNVLVTAATNAIVNALTNQTISVSTNYLFTVMTNLSPALPPATLQPAGDSAAAETNTNAVAVSTSVGPAVATNVTVSLANTASTTAAPNQRTANNQLVRTFNHQLTTISNNLSIALITNLVVTTETNQVVSYVTNLAVVSVTNVIVTPTNGVAYDYFLYTELIPPPDFTLQPQGESLVLLVDGARHGLTQSQSGAAFVARKGYSSALYRVAPEVLVAIANAKEVRVRFKGVNNVVERKMSAGSRQNFRAFLARYFVPDASPASPMKSAAVEATSHVAPR